jgi:hypothetical protein
MRAHETQNIERLAVLHGYRQTLLWATPGPAMLAPYAKNSVYLNVGVSLDGRNRRDRLQMGRRERGDSFQRSTPRECTEGGAEGSPDFQRAEDFGARTIFVTFGSTTRSGGEGLPDLRHVGADERPGIHEYRHRFGRHIGIAGCSAWRHRARHHGRRAGSGRAVERRSIHDYAGRSGRAHHSDDDQGSFGDHTVLLAQRPVQRSPTVGTVADQSGESDQATLNTRRGAPGRSQQVRRGS